MTATTGASAATSQTSRSSSATPACDAIFDTFKAITSEFSRTDRRKLFPENSERFYRL